MPQFGRGQRVHRDAVDQYGALVGVAQPPGQRGQQGLAGAGASHQRDRAAAGDRQVERAEQHLVAVAHHHAAQDDLPVAAGGEGRPAGFGRADGQQFVGPGLPGAGVRHRDQRLDLLEEPGAEGRPAGRGGERPGSQGAAREERPGGGEHRDLDHRDQQGGLPGGAPLRRPEREPGGGQVR